MKILYLPLDERPCNYYYPRMIAESNPKIELILPKIDCLSHKKEAAVFEKIRTYLLENVKNSDVVIISLDMLIYGGLLPSRIHHYSVEKLEKRLNVVEELKAKNPQVKIYAFESIMRCPNYSSSEEEPDYYAKYGHEIFKKKYLIDKKYRVGITELEKKNLAKIKIPEDIVSDYEKRRDINLYINKLTLEYVRKNLLDFLVVPQDDSSPFGYTAIDQKEVITKIKQIDVERKVMVYPGADEVGLSLLARAYNEYYKKKPLIYPFYSSSLGPSIIPLYEDRPMFESLMSQIIVTGARLASVPNEADIILAINSPGKFMQESFEKNKDVTYSSFRHLKAFSYQIEDYIKKNKKVGVIDSAYANGGDEELVILLDNMGLFSRIDAYAGWNTNCNSTGTVLCQLEAGKINLKNNVYHLIEDTLYQARIRQDIIEHVLPKMNLSYYEFNDKEAQVNEYIAEKLLLQYNKFKVAKKYHIDKLKVVTPWHRMFEIGMVLQ